MIRIVLLLALTTQCVCDDGCKKGWERFEDQCYSFQVKSLPWDNAVAACQVQLASLVQLDNPRKDQWVKLKAAGPKGSFWVGGTDQVTEGEWVWIPSGKKILNGSQWRKGQPDNHWRNEDCLEIGNIQSYAWNDSPCNSSRGFICEQNVDFCIPQEF